MFNLRASKYTVGLYTLMMLLLTFAAFRNLSEHLLEGDDFEYLSDTRAIRENPAHFFSPDRQLPGRPVVDLVFVIADSLWGTQPAPYHILLISLHLMASLVLTYTFRQFGADLELCFLGGLLFLVNVSHIRAIQWISCLAYPLALILGLGVVILFRRYLATGQRHWLIGAALALITAILTHPAAISLSLFCAYLSWRSKPTIRQLFSTTIPLVIPALIGSGLLFVFYPQSPQASGTNLSLNPIHLLENLIQYLGRYLSSAHWLVDDLIPGLSFYANEPTNWAFTAGFFICLYIGALIFRKIHLASDWAVWAILMLLPFLNRELVISRYLYFSSAGLSFIFAWSIYAAAHHIKHRPSARFVYGIVLIGLVTSSVLSLKRTEVFAFYSSGRAYIARKLPNTGIAQLKRAIEHAPDIVPQDTYSRLAMIAFGVGEASHDILKRGLQKKPNDPPLNMLLGVSTLFNNNPESRRQAKEHIHRSIEKADNKSELRFGAAVAIYNVGLHYLYNAHQPEYASELFLSSLQLRPNNPLCLLVLGKALQAQGKTREAILACQKALKWQPNFADAHRNLAVFLSTQGKTKEAIQSIEKAVSLDPTPHKSWYLLAKYHQSSGNLNAAYQAIRNALAGDSSEVEYWTEYFNLGSHYYTRGNKERALTIYQTSAKALSNNSKIHYNLGILHYSLGNFAQSVSALERSVQLSPNDTASRRALAEAQEKADQETNQNQQYLATLTQSPSWQE